MLRIPYRATSLALTVCLLVACGGGGGGDGGGTAPPPNKPPPNNAPPTTGTLPGGYNGRITAATLDRSSTPRIAAQVLAELGLTYFVGGITVQSASAGAPPAKSRPRLHDVMQRRVAHAKSISRHDIEDCENPGGTVNEENDISANGTGTLTLTYTNCLEGGVTLNGVTRVTVTRFDLVALVPTEFVVTLENFSVQSGPFRATANGTSAVLVSGGTTRETTNLTARYEPENYFVRLEIVSVDSQFSPGSARQITGRVYHSTYGYVDLETPDTISIGGPTGQEHAVSGHLRMRGAASSSADIRFEPDRSHIELDTDGNGQVDATLSYVTANDLADRANHPPVARAGADVTVDWAASAHLDGSTSTDWENDALTYQWTVPVGPLNPTIIVSDGAVFDFRAPASGDFDVQLSVSDGRNTAVDTVRVTMRARGPGQPGGPGAPPVQNMLGRVLEFGGGDVRDIESDPARNRVYLALRNEVVVLAADTYLIEERVPVGTRPTSLALSSDGSRLYIGLGNGGSLVILDLDTFAKTTIEVATELGTSFVTDVLETQPGVVLIGGSRGEPHEAFLVTVDTNDDNRIRRVAGGEAFHREIRLRLSHDGRYVYVGANEAFARFVLLDNTSSDLPIITSASPVSGVDQFEPNQAGDMLITGSGTIYDALTFERIRIGGFHGVIAAEKGRARLLQLGGNLGISLLDGVTLAETARFSADCPAPGIGIAGVAPVNLRGEWIITLSTDALCVVSTSTPQARPGVAGNRLLPQPPAPVTVSSMRTVLDEPAPSHMVLDATRDVFYVGAPSTQEVILVDASDGGLVNRIALPGEPATVLLSDDGQRLYVALRDQGSVVVINAATRQITRVLDLPAQLGVSGVGGVLEVSPGRLLVGARLGAGNALHPVEVDPADASTARRVGDPRGYCMANFIASPDKRYVYLGSLACGATSEKRDLATPDLQLVATSHPGDFLNLSFVAQSADGSRLYNSDGFTVSASTLRIIGQVQGSGVPFLSQDERRLHMVSDTFMTTYDLETLEIQSTVQSGCFASSLFGTSSWPDRSRFAVLESGPPASVCVLDAEP